ncbi:hypothetical protein [Mesobacillus jeotgali]|uniref:hypothetical protein n=1 Tax=Mesobacillus jeotgali TaxID=129985 RepID=UPI00177B48C7|nr:hypothetical protein [Mesobacillus jeotgali]UYZ21757.1 hypothetical protein FOF60_22625 [Mesobacillus jeotgali]
MGSIIGMWFKQGGEQIGDTILDFLYGGWVNFGVIAAVMFLTVIVFYLFDIG